jgi:hypothetical protein
MATTLPTDDHPSQVEPTLADPVEEVDVDAVAPPLKRNLAWVWVILACVMLGSSSFARWYQDKRHNEEASIAANCPFPLESMPREIGRWKSLRDDQKLDSRTLQITGGKEYSIRVYEDGLTGNKLVVLLLFGPVQPVIPHVPDVCYPANGFAKLDEPLARTVKFSYLDASGQEVPRDAVLMSALYKKGSLQEGVYHSFRYNGAWTPFMNPGGKFPRRDPGVFKLQVQRLVAPGESRNSDKYLDPIEDFLKLYLAALEHEVSVGTAAKAVASK